MEKRFSFLATFVYLAVIAFIVAGILLSLANDLMVLLMQCLLTMLTGFLLFRRYLVLNKRKQIHAMVAELVTPFTIWLLFDISGILAIINADTSLYLAYDDTSVLVMSLYASLGMFIYLWVFQRVFPVKKMADTPVGHPSWYQIFIITLSILLFDWYVRYNLIQSGSYFYWVMRQVADVNARNTSLAYHIYRTLSFVPLALLVYIAYYVRRIKIGWFFKVLVLIQLLLVAAEGNRRNIVYACAVILFSLLIMNRKKIKFTTLFAAAMTMLFLTFVLGPIIQVARFQIRADLQYLKGNVSEIPVVFITKYIPDVARQMIYGEYASTTNNQTPSVMWRTGAYAAYAASIYQSYTDGTPLLPPENFLNSLSTVIPRFLFPNKAVVDADAVVNVHFGVADSATDTNSTYITNVFAHAHVFGICGMMILVAIIIAFSTRQIVRDYGVFGQVLVIGLFPNFTILADSFGSYLGVMRNILLLALFFWLFKQVGYLVVKRKSSVSIASSVKNHSAISKSAEHT